MSLRRFCAIVAGLVLTVTGLTIPAAGSAAAETAACTVPNGYTYTRVVQSSQCATGGLANLYYITRPADGLVACTVVGGFTYTFVAQGSNCATGGLARQYTLAAPRTGLVACTVPDGFTYTYVAQGSSCATGGLANQYTLLQA